MKPQLPAESNNNRSNTNDRRQEKTVPGAWYLFYGRRSKVRRIVDYQKSFFLDHFSLRVFIIIISVVLLSVIDAILTLYLIHKGVAVESNPIMAQYLKYGPLPFLTAKYLLTATSMILLLVYKDVYIFKTKFRAKYLFIVFFAIFASVVIWELYLVCVT